MLKNSILVILIIITLFTFSSCNRISNDNAIIQIWSYDLESHSGYSKATASILSNIKFFVIKTKFPLRL